MWRRKIRTNLKETGYFKNEKHLEKYRHIVTRSVSGNPQKSIIGYSSMALSQGESVILCSDGVHNILSIHQLIEILNHKTGLEELEVNYLKEAEDNYSLIEVRL